MAIALRTDNDAGRVRETVRVALDARQARQMLPIQRWFWAVLARLSDETTVEFPPWAFPSGFAIAGFNSPTCGSRGQAAGIALMRPP